jgi:hypothetical protein
MKPLGQLMNLDKKLKQFEAHLVYDGHTPIFYYGFGFFSIAQIGGIASFQ